MKVELIRIGNSRGIRIPRPIIDQCGFGETVQLRVENDRLVIARDRTPRQGWDEQFTAAGKSAGDEVVLGAMPGNRFDDEEWRW